MERKGMSLCVYEEFAHWHYVKYYSDLLRKLENHGSGRYVATSHLIATGTGIRVIIIELLYMFICFSITIPSTLLAN